MSMGNFFDNIFLVLFVISIIFQVYDMFRHRRFSTSGILQQLSRISGTISIADNRFTDFHHISVRPNERIIAYRCGTFSMGG